MGQIQSNYRAKNIETGEWHYGDLITFDDGYHIRSLLDYDFGKTYNVNPDSVGANIGLNDRKGNRLYEKDIVYPNQWNPTTYEIQWNFAHACYELNPHQVPIMFAENMKRIGNSVDNPELLSSEPDSNES